MELKAAGIGDNFTGTPTPAPHAPGIGQTDATPELKAIGTAMLTMVRPPARRNRKRAFLKGCSRVSTQAIKPLLAKCRPRLPRSIGYDARTPRLCLLEGYGQAAR